MLLWSLMESGNGRACQIFGPNFRNCRKGSEANREERPHADRDRPGRKHSLAAINIGEHHVPGHFMSVQLYAN